MDAQGEQLPDLCQRESNALSAPNKQEPAKLVSPDYAEDCAVRVVRQ